ncbi:pseudouridine synthase [Pelagibaculum spongiae]|uniref:Pseudouridine synthase n=1 Tax=Pelagibaculum spongiae TaxID=2080658 RepID=A0A2V1GVR9_9GAMM|nr:pseudouridine synthase [Pelagibaculum spongiae]PVZ70495.1 16S rRNA pseudouridine(516) synthase [Pelagibaculum spongiae]
MRLDRFLSNQTPLSRKALRIQLATGQVLVNGKIIRDGQFEIDDFCTIQLAGQLLPSKPAMYFMLNKPIGHVSATTDPQHPTVNQLFPPSLASQLHYAGRLDRNTSGLMLMTNDGTWSRILTEPNKKIAKKYWVETANPICQQTHQLFADGVHLMPEDITTSPAQLEQISANQAWLTIYEGRYHQIKRMFGKMNNPVIKLHRHSLGNIQLDSLLAASAYRALTLNEILDSLPEQQKALYTQLRS